MDILTSTYGSDRVIVSGSIRFPVAGVMCPTWMVSEALESEGWAELWLGVGHDSEDAAILSSHMCSAADAHILPSIVRFFGSSYPYSLMTEQLVRQLRKVGYKPLNDMSQCTSFIRS